MRHLPEIHPSRCLNGPHHRPQNSAAFSPCQRCQQACPAHAIAPNANALPQLDGETCTGCTAYVRVCPVDAITHDALQLSPLLAQIDTQHGASKMHLVATCSAVKESSAPLNLPCHAAWDPLLLATMAARGVKQLTLIGLNECATCPIRFGAEIMAQTERDYATLNAALGVEMTIVHASQHEAMTQFDNAHAAPPPQNEPPRRTFFRTLIPSLTQGAAGAAAQVALAAGQAMRPQQTEEDAAASMDDALPQRLRLFIQALPKLQANFTPIPYAANIPIGAIQADDRCTACGDCVKGCPTDALAMREFGANRVLEFRPDACMGCQRCLQICPEQALEPLPGISLPAMLPGKARPLVMVSANKYY